MATEDDKINTGALATVVAVGALGMIGVSLAVNALVRHEVGSIGAERDATGEVAYRALREAQEKKLSAPAAWSDAAKGRASIPIDRAMGLVLADLKRSPWNASPVPPPDAGADAAPSVDPTLPDAGADAGGTEVDAGTSADAGAAPEPPAGTPLSPSVPAPPTSAKPAPAPRPSAAPPKTATPGAPTAAAPKPGTPAPTAPAPPASPTPPATP